MRLWALSRRAPRVAGARQVRPSGPQGVAKDETEAVKWYRKAAEQGNEDACHKLAEMGVDKTAEC